MIRPNQTKVGSVNLVDLQKKPSANYSDGSIEDKILKHFKDEKSPESFLAKDNSWPAIYHLSRERENLLNWLDVDPDSSVLEVGAGCGAITKLLAEKAKKVRAVELSKRRATINAHRNQSNNNLEVVIGNLEDLGAYSTEKYDYVVCVGVLEYAGRFISGDRPFESFLKFLRKFTKDNGTLVLAIENKLGLKYWSGAKEDHTQRYLEGIEDYPHYDGIKTFGKKELSDLLGQSGYSDHKFYYPFPDYKLPHTIFSDDYLPGVHTQNIPSSLYPSPSPDQTRQQIFREQLAVRTLAKNNMFDEFANSFLVLATSSTKANANQPIFARSNISRKQPYRVITKLAKTEPAVFSKSPLDSSAKDHVLGIEKNRQLIQKSLKGKSVGLNKIYKVSGDSVSFHSVAGRDMENMLIEAICRGDQENAKKIIGNYQKLLDSFESKKTRPSTQAKFTEIFGKDIYQGSFECIYPGILDLNFDNIINDGDGYTLIDYEWVYDCYIPKQMILTRALVYFLTKHSQIIRATTTKDNPSTKVSDNLVIPDYILNKYLTREALAQYTKSERSFQEHVTGSSSVPELYNAFSHYDNDLLDNLADSYSDPGSPNDLLNAARLEIQQKDKAIQELQNNLAAITNSRSWKVISKIASVRRRVHL